MGRELWRRKSFCTLGNPHGQAHRRDLEPQRWAQLQMCRGKGEDSAQRSAGQFPLVWDVGMHTEQVEAWCRGSGFREVRSQGRLGLPATKTVWGASTTHSWGSQGKAWACHKSKESLSLILKLHKVTDDRTTPPQVPEAVISDPRGECFSHCHCHWAVSKHRSLPTLSREPVQLGTAKGTHDLEPTPLGECSLPQAVATSYRPLPPQALPTLPSCVCSFPPSPWPEWASEP